MIHDEECGPGRDATCDCEARAQSSADAAFALLEIGRLKAEDARLRALLQRWLDETNHIPEVRGIYRETMAALAPDGEVK